MFLYGCYNEHKKLMDIPISWIKMQKTTNTCLADCWGMHLPVLIFLLKGQLISKWLFGFFKSPKKGPKNFCPSRLEQKINIFKLVFFGELKTLKFPFEMNWPLFTSFMRGSSHIWGVPICVRYQNCCRNLDVYLVLILLGQIQSKPNSRLVTYKLPVP